METERTDARLLQGVVVALAIVYPLVAMLPTVDSWIRTKTITWTSVGSGGAGDVLITGAGSEQLLAALAPALFTWGLLQLGCAAAFLLAHNVAAGGSVGPAVRQVRVLALVVLGYGVLVPIVRSFAGLYLTSTAGQAGSLVWAIDLSTVAVFIVVGLLIMVAAECIAIAVRPAAAGELA